MKVLVNDFCVEAVGLPCDSENSPQHSSNFDTNSTDITDTLTKARLREPNSVVASCWVFSIEFAVFRPVALTNAIWWGVDVPRRQDVQIWRGVAVLGVMLAHFGALVPAGVFGVDIFFAISGFVITLSLLTLVRTGRGTKSVLYQFWRRRFWRLVPALITVLSVTVVAAFFVLSPRNFRVQVEMTIWSTFFAGNVGAVRVSTGDYFNPGAEENWLLHVWSPGVEEQFYPLFPILFIASVGIGAKTLQKNRLIAAVAVLSAVSLTLASVDDVVRFRV